MPSSDPNKVRLQKKAWADSHKENVAKHSEKLRLYRFYRITPEERKAIEEFQKTETPALLGKRNGLDHSHETGLVRGLLDFRLNRALGMVESVNKEQAAELLRGLANFLENPPVTLALGREVYGLLGKAKYKKKMVYGSPSGPLPVEKKKRGAK